jgi:hypothetical protein
LTRHRLVDTIYDKAKAHIEEPKAASMPVDVPITGKFNRLTGTLPVARKKATEQPAPSGSASRPENFEGYDSDHPN